jgi:hypothetical protein
MTETIPLEDAIRLAKEPMERAGLLAATPGRLTVAPGQPIASSWGNTTHDQTCLCFANAGDRDNQWPAPNDGALCYLADSRTVWRRVGGAWRSVGMGLVVPMIPGPVGTVDVTTPARVLIDSGPMNLIGGRKYRVTMNATATVITAAVAIGYWQLADTAGIMPVARMIHGFNLAVGSGFPITGTVIYSPANNVTTNFQLAALASSGGLRVLANAAFMWIEDIGG